MHKIKKLAWVAFWLLLLFYVLGNPTAAAGNARDLAGLLESGAHSAITFMQGVTAHR